MIKPNPQSPPGAAVTSIVLDGYHSLDSEPRAKSTMCKVNRHVVTILVVALMFCLAASLFSIINSKVDLPDVANLIKNKFGVS